MPATSFYLQPQTPASKREAVTRASVIDGSRGRDAQWTWYYSCIREMLSESGCPASRIDDIAHDLILERLEPICRGYDRSKGRFRPYLYRCVANGWRDRMRQHRASGSALHRPIEHADPPASRTETRDEAPRPDLGEFTCFLDRLFARFMRDMTRKQVGFFLLRDWCLTGRDVEAAIAEHQLTLAPAYARKLRAQAIADFARFAQDRLDPADLAEMVTETEADGDEIRFPNAAPSLVQALRWPSEDKRLGIMAKILRHLYRKYQARGTSFDEL